MNILIYAYKCKHMYEAIIDSYYNACMGFIGSIWSMPVENTSIFVVRRPV